MSVKCTIDVPKRYSCVVCHKAVHSGNEGCACSTFRIDVFAWGSLCITCAKAFDRLMGDKELQPVLKYLLEKEFSRGAGPVIDF